MYVVMSLMINNKWTLKISLMRKELEKKVDRAIRLLRSVPLKNGEPIEIAYSGGKDSDVILELARMAGITFKAIYKCTTIDPPGTIKHALDNGCEIRRPKRTFFNMVRDMGLPNRFMRFCCRELKEYPIYYNCVIGVRKAESRARNERYKEPVVCRVYSKERRIQQILPILDWSDDEELEFIKERNIRLHPLYYNDDGIDITRRLGCLCCPLKSPKRRIEDFKRYPKMLRQYVRNAKVYFDSHPDSAAHKWACNVYEWIYAEIMYSRHSDYMEKEKNLLFPHDESWYKESLERYFSVDLTI